MKKVGGEREREREAKTVIAQCSHFSNIKERRIDPSLQSSYSKQISCAANLAHSLLQKM